MLFDSISLLNNISYIIFLDKSEKISQSFICLHPKAQYYGGWGNVVTYSITLMQLGYVS